MLLFNLRFNYWPDPLLPYPRELSRKVKECDLAPLVHYLVPLLQIGHHHPRLLHHGNCPKWLCNVAEMTHPRDTQDRSCAQWWPDFSAKCLITLASFTLVIVQSIPTPNPPSSGIDYVSLGLNSSTLVDPQQVTFHPEALDDLPDQTWGFPSWSHHTPPMTEFLFKQQLLLPCASLPVRSCVMLPETHGTGMPYPAFCF